MKHTYKIKYIKTPAQEFKRANTFLDGFIFGAFLVGGLALGYANAIAELNVRLWA